MSAVEKLRGKLEVHVIAGHDLRDRELIGKMDPLVIVKFGKEEFKSRVIKNGGTNPKWDQFFEFNLKEEDADTPLKFEVYDHKVIGKDREVGRADVPLHFLVTHAGGKEDGHSFNLVHFENPDKEAGKIQIGIRYEGDGVPREKDLKRKAELEKEALEEAKKTAAEEKAKEGEEAKELEEAKKKAEDEKAKEAQLEAEKQKLAEEKKQLEEKLAAAQSQGAQGGSAHGKHVLHRHERLRIGQKLVSENGKFTATLQQEDGNFVLADQGGLTWWAAATNDTGATELILQKDNNLVIYDSTQRPQWASNTEGSGEGPARLILQNDGNLALFDQADVQLWATNTGSPQ